MSLLVITLFIVFIIPIVITLHALLLHQSLLGNYPMAIRWLAHRHLLRQSITFYEDEFAGRIATKVMQTALAIRETVMKILDVLIYISVYFISILLLMWDMNWRLMLPFLVWALLYAALQTYYIPKLKDIARLQADSRASMTGRIVDSYTHIMTVKLFSHTNRQMNYTKHSMKDFLHTVYHQMRLVTGLNIWVDILNYSLVLILGFISIFLWEHSLLEIGSIAVALSLALRLNGMSKWIMWELSGLFESVGTVIDGMRTLSAPITLSDKPNSTPIIVTQGAIEFQNVFFHYDHTHPPIIKDFNLTIKPGEKIGLIGRSGSEKSTLINLLIRLYEVQSGKMLIDGHDLANATQDSLRQHIGIVTQDTALLHRSIRDNILYGRPNANEADLISAAKQAHAHDFILELTDHMGKSGYDALVGERGIKLSGGQRQRIAIARVLLKNAPILILGEATSALDSEVEDHIQTSLNTLMVEKTVIAIAHRLSTIAKMDRLIVIDEGKIIEQGTHQSLLELSGVYAQLWAHQTKGFIGEQ